MNVSTWRDTWPPFRIELVEETARCLTNRGSSATGGALPRWEALTSAEQENAFHIVARTFLAQDEAMQNLIQRTKAS